MLPFTARCTIKLPVYFVIQCRCHRKYATFFSLSRQARHLHTSHTGASHRFMSSAFGRGACTSVPCASVVSSMSIRKSYRRTESSHRHGHSVVARPRKVSKVLRGGLDLDALLPPDIDGDLEGLQEEAGGVFDEDGFVLNFGSKELELNAIETGAAVIDRSDWGLVRVSGPGAAAALRALSGDASSALTPAGSGFAMRLAFGDSDGDARAQIYSQSEGFLIITPPSVTVGVLETLEGVPEQSFMELNDKCALLTVVGPTSIDILRPTGLAQVVDEPMGSHRVFGFENRPVIAARTPEYAGEGLNLIVDEGIAGQVWATITRAGIVPAGSEASNAFLAKR